MVVEKSTEKNVLAAHYLEGNRFHVRAVRRLSQSEADAVRANLDAIFAFDKHRQLFGLVKENQNDLYNLMKENLSKMPHGFMQPDTSISNSSYIQLSKGVLNLLGSLKVYLEFSEAYLKRKYGSDSSEFKIFKKSQNDRFDESFSYRFCYKLRNYTQHCGLPVGEVVTKTAHWSSTDRTTTMTIMLSRSELLESFDWGRHVVSGLEQLPENFDVMPHLIEFSSHVKSLSDELVELDFPSVKTSFEKLTSMVQEVFSQHPDSKPVIYRLYTKGQSLGDLFWFPTGLFSELERYNK